MKASRAFALVSALLVLVTLLQPAAAAPAAIDGPNFTVDWLGDEADPHPGNGICEDSTGKCTLRAALQEANFNSDTNRIYFDVPGVTTVRTLAITTAPLPTITSPVIIDASTQELSDTNCISPCIKLDGSALDGNPSGLYLHASGSTIKGLIFVSFYTALEINGSSNLILGNSFGIVPGVWADGSNGYAIALSGSNNLIGGAADKARNLIGGSAGTGVIIGDLSYVTNTGNQVKNNYIGVSEDGTTDYGNTTGIHVTSGATDTLIQNNVVSGNFGVGILVAGDDVDIRGNYIGTRADGNGSLPNGQAGIRVYDGTRGVVIGGTTSTSRNRIKNNEGDGILILDGPEAAIVSIQRNIIYGNQDLGIDLMNDGVTSNDGLDADTGPNGLQNFPIISSANSTTDTIVAKLYSKPNVTYRIEFFSSPAGSCDPSGYGEGQKFLGKATGTTDATGYVRVTFTSPIGFVAGQVITATATNSQGKTSEFSKCKTAG